MPKDELLSDRLYWKKDIIRRFYQLKGLRWTVVSAFIPIFAKSVGLLKNNKQ